MHDELHEKVNMMTEWVVDEGKRVAISHVYPFETNTQFPYKFTYLISHLNSYLTIAWKYDTAVYSLTKF